MATVTSERRIVNAKLTKVISDVLNGAKPSPLLDEGWGATPSGQPRTDRKSVV